MPYDPSVNDISGQLYGKYLVGASEAEAEGIVNSAKIRAEQRRRDEEALSAGIDKLQSGISQGVETYSKYKQQRDYYDSAFEGQQRFGVWGPKDIEAYTKAPMGKKAEMITRGQMQVDLSLRDVAAESADARKLRLHAAENVLDQSMEPPSRVGEVITREDPLTHQKRAFIYQNENQLLPFEGTTTSSAAGKGQITGNLRRMPVGGGQYIWVDEANRVVSPKMMGGAEDPSAAVNLMTDTGALRKVQDELAKQRGLYQEGKGDIRYGPDWLPIGKKRTEAISQLEEQEKMLRSRIDQAGAGPSQGPATPSPQRPAAPYPGGGPTAAGTATGPRKYNSREEVQAAYGRNEISFEQAQSILQTQFGME